MNECSLQTAGVDTLLSRATPAVWRLHSSVGGQSQSLRSFKLRGQRIFRMAPIHHHYELKGWPEPRVIVRFWIISLMLVLIGLATLKVR